MLEDRNYVRLEKKRFIPEDRGRMVTAFLTNFFERYVAVRLHRRSGGEARRHLRRARRSGRTCCATSGWISPPAPAGQRPGRFHAVDGRRGQLPRFRHRQALGRHRRAERKPGAAFLPADRGRHANRASARPARTASSASSSARPAPSSAAATIRNAATPARSRSRTARRASWSARSSSASIRRPARRRRCARARTATTCSSTKRATRSRSASRCRAA